jgi:hypothetical protein
MQSQSCTAIHAMLQFDRWINFVSLVPQSDAGRTVAQNLEPIQYSTFVFPSLLVSSMTPWMYCSGTYYLGVLLYVVYLYSTSIMIIDCYSNNHNGTRQPAKRDQRLYPLCSSS